MSTQTHSGEPHSSEPDNDTSGQAVETATGPITASADSEVPWQQLDPNYVQAERMSDMIAMGILGVIVLIAWAVTTFVIFSPFSYIGWLVGLIGLVVSGLLGWLGWFHPQWYFNTTRWREVHRGFEIRRGIWWWHRIFIPRERIQHTDVIRGPLMRRYGLAKLVIYTAGSHNHEITLEGLGAEQAENLRQSLLPQSSSLDKTSVNIPTMHGESQ